MSILEAHPGWSLEYIDGLDAQDLLDMQEYADAQNKIAEEARKRR